MREPVDAIDYEYQLKYGADYKDHLHEINSLGAIAYNRLRRIREDAKKMLDYSGPEYENLYQEILIDSTFTYGKFNPIPYPIFKASQIEGAARQK